jgi:6,7-dimethyl-8-ribityllumazine synthase
MKKTAGSLKGISGRGLKFGIVVGRFNQDITVKLLEGAQRAFLKAGVAEKDLKVVWVPGAFEMPVMLQHLARSKKYNALLALGAVIRGETPHFDYVAGEASRGIMQVSLIEKIPIAFGLLTTNNIREALDRVGGRHGHKGEEAALVAIEMSKLVKHG